MDHQDNPILNPAFADRDRTLSLISTPKLAPPSKPKVPPIITKMVLELGLRYRPSEQADLINHTTLVGLLAQDLADVPPKWLEIAIRNWVAKSPFMPKASDLIDLARGAQASAGKGLKDQGAFAGPYTIEGYVSWANEMLGKERYKVAVIDGRKNMVDA